VVDATDVGVANGDAAAAGVGGGGGLKEGVVLVRVGGGAAV